MSKIYLLIALLIGLVSCSEQKSEVAQLLQAKNANDSFVMIDTSLIEQWTHRELLCVDTTKLHPHELRHLNSYLKEERKNTKSNVMCATGYKKLGSVPGDSLFASFLL